MVSTIDDDFKAIAEIPEVKGRDPGETLSDLVLKYTSLKASLEQVRTAAPVRIVCTSIDSPKRPETAHLGVLGFSLIFLRLPVNSAHMRAMTTGRPIAHYSDCSSDSFS